MQSQSPSLFKPRRVAAKLHYSIINQFMYIWVKWSRPCDLKIQRSKQSPELLGICFNVENNDTSDMMKDVIKTLNVEILDL